MSSNFRCSGSQSFPAPTPTPTPTPTPKNKNCSTDKDTDSDAQSLVQISTHVQLCVPFFRAMIVRPAQGQPLPLIPGAVGLIYANVIDMLERLTQSGELCGSIDGSAQKYDCHSHGDALDSLRDLVLLSSFCCSPAAQSDKHTSSCASLPAARHAHTHTRTPEVSSPASLLIALAPYWAVALLLSHHGALFASVPETVFRAIERTSRCRDDESLLDALHVLLTHAHTGQATRDVADVLLARVVQTHTLLQRNGQLLISHCSLFARMKRALKRTLRTPLHCAVLLGLAIRSDLSAQAPFIASSLSPLTALRALSHADECCLEVVNTLVRAAPMHAMVTDGSAIEATPLVYASAFRTTDFLPSLSLSLEELSALERELRVDPHVLNHKLPLELCRVLAHFCPSSLAIADKTGMLPLHCAARRGDSATLVFLCTNFPFACPLKDATGKLALHHALLSHAHHSEHAILQLAAMFPSPLLGSSNGSGNSGSVGDSMCCNSFNVMHYVKKNCAASLWTALQEMARFHRGGIALPLPPAKKNKRKNRSTMYDSENDGDVDSDGCCRHCSSTDEHSCASSGLDLLMSAAGDIPSNESKDDNSNSDNDNVTFDDNIDDSSTESVSRKRLLSESTIDASTDSADEEETVTSKCKSARAASAAEAFILLEFVKTLSSSPSSP